MKKNSTEILAALDACHPGARCELDFSSPLQLAVAVVLSAQCTDARVNAITPALFAKYPRPEDYLAVPPEELENDIRSAGFFRQKTKSIRGIMAALIGRHGGQVPGSMAELVALPGVGRKTANVILSNAFGKAEGIAVDTHVGRVARRLGISRHENPDKVEGDLLRFFPKSRWADINHLLVFHGRYICKARKPLCEQCPLVTICAFFRRTSQDAAKENG